MATMLATNTAFAARLSGFQAKRPAFCTDCAGGSRLHERDPCCLPSARLPGCEVSLDLAPRMSGLRTLELQDTMLRARNALQRLAAVRPLFRIGNRAGVSLIHLTSFFGSGNDKIMVLPSL